MATCSLGTTNIKLVKYDFGGKRINHQKLNCSPTWLGRRQLQSASIAILHKPSKALRMCCGSSLEAETATKKVDTFEETKSSDLKSQLIPNASQVESLVTEICNTSIAEFELKLGGFRLYVTRDVTEKSTALPLPLPSADPDPISANTTTDIAASNGSVSSTSLAIFKPEPSPGNIQSFLDKAADEGLGILQSPMVGLFRRSRIIKGKRAPPSCDEKKVVKEGQVLCFIEQLGCQFPVESRVSGEVIKILREDGEPVGYGDALIAILPSFPGIKKLQ